MRLKVLGFLGIAAALFQAGCAGEIEVRPEAEWDQEVIAALALYREAVVNMDAGAIAALFEEHATIAHGDQWPVVGRDDIRRFLESFAGYKVLTYEIEAQSTSVQGRVADQAGSYRQVAVAPNGETIRVQGRFRARWERQASGQWLILSMRTAPT